MRVLYKPGEIDCFAGFSLLSGDKLNALSRWAALMHHEPLVTPEVFVRAANADLGHSTKRKQEKHPQIEKIYCGGSGYALKYKPKRRDLPRYFWCSQRAILQIPERCTYFDAPILEEAVLTLWNKELICRGDLLRQRGDLEQFQKQVFEGLVREYRKQYHDMQKEKDSLYENYDMKLIIRYSYLEELTQEVEDIFIKKVTVYNGKRVEIE